MRCAIARQCASAHPLTSTPHLCTTNAIRGRRLFPGSPVRSRRVTVASVSTSSQVFGGAAIVPPASATQCADKAMELRPNCVSRVVLPAHPLATQKLLSTVAVRDNLMSDLRYSRQVSLGIEYRASRTESLRDHRASEPEYRYIEPHGLDQRNTEPLM